MENKPKIRTYDDPRLMNLKRAAYSNNVVKGLKETVRLIKAGRAEQVFVADNELGEKYTSIIKEYLKAYQDKEILEVEDFTILRDIVMKTKPSELVEINQTKYKKDTKKKGPKCYCAAINQTNNNII